MKLEKLKHPVDDVKIVNKINEIIDVLNNSFITNDPGIVECLDSLVSISCDRLNPLSNETTAPETRSSLTSDHLVNMMSDSLSLEPNVWADKKCPHCGASYYTPKGSYTTALYCPPIYKDGVSINNMKNTSKTTYHCLSCDRCWEETD